METTKELIKGKEELLNKAQIEKNEHEALLAKINPDLDLTRQPTVNPERPVLRNFVHKYAVIYCNKYYDKLREIYPGMKDLKWVRRDEKNARATIDMMQIRPENKFFLIDSTWD